MRWLSLVVLVLLSVPVGADDSRSASQLSELLNEENDLGFAKAGTVRPFSFPEDYGPHEAFRNEWWYITGNLDDEQGRRFGFEITIFRFSLTPTPPDADSAWRTNQVYIAHLAVTDADRERFYVAERYSRGALGLAGAQADPFRVWIDDWEIAAADDRESWDIHAVDGEIALDLALTPLRDPVLNGNAGLSRKSSNIDSASYYYSITRLQTEGTLTIDGTDYAVSGLSWLDREWSTSALASDQVGSLVPLGYAGHELTELGLLALASLFVVTGESMSMLAEASSTNKPLLIFDMGDGDVTWWRLRHNYRYKPLSHRLAMRFGPRRMRRRGLAIQI